MGDDPFKKTPKNSKRSISIKQLGFCGGVVGLLTGLVLSTDPVSMPIFTVYGLSHGAFIGTEAASALFLYLSKISTFSYQDFLPVQVVLTGVFVGGGIVLGTFCSKPFVRRLSGVHFSLLIDVMLLVAGAGLVFSAFFHK
ncbi:TSUP family transporter [Providencia sp. wls1943]|uniref:TSUP family transporter n=1 Tax=Providencia sp. wls1943 TaxID=2675150 RepID=UPI0012B67640|nr:TSUP family transporter [Providencia sp. wls1943]MTB66390.1 TSUP family transporter [Providencia sp. wls1943]